MPRQQEFDMVRSPGGHEVGNASTVYAWNKANTRMDCTFRIYPADTQDRRYWPLERTLTEKDNFEFRIKFEITNWVANGIARIGLANIDNDNQTNIVAIGFKKNVALGDAIRPIIWDSTGTLHSKEDAPTIDLVNRQDEEIQCIGYYTASNRTLTIEVYGEDHALIGIDTQVFPSGVFFEVDSLALLNRTDGDFVSNIDLDMYLYDIWGPYGDAILIGEPELEHDMDTDPGGKVTGAAGDFSYDAGNDWYVVIFDSETAINRIEWDLLKNYKSDERNLEYTFLFYMHHTGLNSWVANKNGALMNVGNKDHANNYQNEGFGINFRGDGTHAYARARVCNSDGTVTYGNEIDLTSYDLKWLSAVVDYNKDTGVVTVDFYDDSHDLIDTSTVTLASGSFTVNMFFFGNMDEDLASSADCTGYFDDIKVGPVLQIEGFDEEHLSDFKVMDAVSEDGQDLLAWIDNQEHDPLIRYDEFDLLEAYSAGIKVFSGRIEDLRPTQDKRYGNVVEVYGRGMQVELTDRMVLEVYTAQVRSAIVNDLLTNYAPHISNNNVTTTTTAITRTFRGVTPWDIILEMAKEEGFEVWVDLDDDLHFEEREFEKSDQSIVMGTDDIIDFDFPNEGREIINRVYVYGDPDVGGGQPIAMAEDRESQEFYGQGGNEVIKSKVIVDKEIQTEAEAQSRAEDFIDQHAWIIPHGRIKVIGYENLRVGTTVSVDFDTDCDVSGEYLVLTKIIRGATDEVELSLVGYNEGFQHIIADLIKDMRKVSGYGLDTSAVTTRIERLYETIALEGNLKIYKITNGDTFIWGHPTNGLWGLKKWGRSGGAFTKEVDVDL